jgi:predicted  nucleic acid-binding Zn-ribbon protein
VKEQFARLLALQQLDADLRTLRDKAAAIPRRIEELRRAAAELKAGLDAAKHDILEHRKQYKLAEVELKAAEEKAGSYSVQLYSAKTNEQYKAFLKEIETQKRLSSEIEDRMIVLMEEIEGLDRKVKAAEKQAGEVDLDVAAKVKLVETEQAEIDSAVAVRDRQRSSIVEALPPEVVKRYERIRASKGGVAVASTRGGRCNGCLSPVPAQRLLEVGRCDRMFLCEACGRILVPGE